MLKKYFDHQHLLCQPRSLSPQSRNKCTVIHHHHYCLAVQHPIRKTAEQLIVTISISPTTAEFEKYYSTLPYLLGTYLRYCLYLKLASALYLPLNFLHLFILIELNPLHSSFKTSIFSSVLRLSHLCKI